MGLITDLIKNGFLKNEHQEKQLIKISKEQQGFLRNGDAVLIEDSFNRFIVKIKDSSIKKNILINDDFDIRQI